MITLSDKKKKAVRKIDQTGNTGQKTHKPEGFLFKER